MCVRVIAPTKDTGSGSIVGEEMPKPVCIIFGGPSLLSMTIQAMNSNDATRWLIRHHVIYSRLKAKILLTQRRDSFLLTERPNLVDALELAQASLSTTLVWLLEWVEKVASSVSCRKKSVTIVIK
jgi:hypothetical protein